MGKGERDNYIDFLRFIGLTLIVLAHIEPPFALFQIRTFDVPLMVFVSGLSYSGRRIKPSWSGFFWPRIKRIIIPTYLFLTAYFILLWILKSPFTAGTVVKSFLLLTEGGIGFVWIMRVFLLIMLVTPLLCYTNERLDGWRYYLVIVGLFVLDCLIVCATANMERSRWLVLFSDTIPFLLGYSVLFMLGLRMRSNSTKQNLTLLAAITAIAALAFSVYLRTAGLPVDIHAFKYPPTSYFIVYGIFSCALLWCLRRILAPLSNNAFLLFLGQNTIWIYFWHVLLLIFAYEFFENWVLRFLFSYFGAIAQYSIQYFATRFLMNKTRWNGLKYLIA